MLVVRFSRRVCPVGPVVICLVVLGGLLLAASQSRAAVLSMNFDSRKHGQIIDTEYVATKGVTISARNLQGGPDLAIIFDSNRTYTDDHDLEAPWDMGNLATSTSVSKLLILAENDADADGDGRIDRPDDQGAEPADGLSGEITFNFNTPIKSLALDLIDVEDGIETDEGIGYLSFRFKGSELARVMLSEFTNPSSGFYDRTVVYGDNSANRIQPITAEALQVAGFDQVVVGMGLCLGIDNVVFETGLADIDAQVPEPGALMSMLLALPALAPRRRRA
jgi:hypothetical protein